MVKMEYSQRELEVAFEKYCQRTDRVMEVIRLAQLTKYDIHTVVNASSDFMFINTVRQHMMGEMLIATIEDKLNVFRELVINSKPDLDSVFDFVSDFDFDFVSDFLSIPLKVEKDKFIFVAYDTKTVDYALHNASLYQELPKGWLMVTAGKVPFYLVKEVDVNDTFPLRVRLGDISFMMQPTDEGGR